ncbi:MAG: integrase arm-type DNA-binding domain-containing protein [Methylococcaceae bacterium]|nr:integrase arm-type DNA-binding domain-containing protein [Methylococcaceae bacterium]MDP2393535.1 integrase arm-type DNA-binding domain-containing protein [Methylococcaceae bacterium]
MARVKQLTVKQIENIKTAGYYADGKGLYLQVSKTISKSWLFIYWRDKKKTEVGLGSLFDVSLSEAREKALELNKQVSNGINPLKEKTRKKRELALAEAKDMTFQECADAYIEINRHGWSNPKHAQQWTNTLSQYAYPLLGQLSIADIDTALVTKCLEPIWITKNETASRLRGRIEQVLSWATVKQYRSGDNPARWRGHLDKILPKPSKVQTTKHHPALPYEEIADFISLLRQQEGVAARCLEFTILTAARTNESIGATWDEINLDSKVWTIPAMRMKAGKEHRVALSDKSIDLLKQMKACQLSEYVFTSGKKNLSNMAMLALLKRMNRKDITAHGFRSSFRDWAAESTSYPNELLEKCLAHTIKNESEAAYRRGDLLEKRFRVMNDW